MMRLRLLQFLFLTLCTTVSQAQDYQRYYENLPVEVSQVTQVTIPDNVVNITEMGGVGDGATLNTDAFTKAISKLTKLGGGKIIVPEGVWLTGPIMLKDNIELNITKNAILYFSPDKSLYVEPKGTSKRAYPCIRASKRKNIAITGSGIIDGNGSQWRPVKRSKQSDVEWKQYQEMGGQVTEDGSLWYPWKMKNGYEDIAPTPKQQEGMRNDLIRLTDCENILIQGVTIQNSPRFHVHPCNSKNVIVDGVTIRCPWNAQNGDAIDFSDVNIGLIVNCTVDAGDDGLCMKSGAYKPESPANGCEDIVIQDNTVFHAHGGFVLGSETVTGMKRIVVRHNRFCGTDTGLRFKSGIGRGGRTEDLYISDIVMTDIAAEAIIFQCDYADQPAGRAAKGPSDQDLKNLKNVPEFQGINISNITCRDCKIGIRAKGIADLNCVHDINISDCTITYNKDAQQIDAQTAKINLSNVRLLENKRQ